MTIKSKYSPVAPIEVLEYLHKQLSLDYLLVLAHEVVQDPGRYSRLIESIRKQSLDAVIILDNGIVENGSIDIGEVIEAYNIVNPTYTILPDVIGDARATYINTEEFLDAYNASLAGTDGYMYVLQTIDPGDTARTAHKILCATDMVTSFALPRYQTNYALSHGHPGWTRYAHLRALEMAIRQEYIPGFPIHLLGMSEDSYDDFISACRRGVMGIDSANPVVQGYYSINTRIFDAPHLDRNPMWNDKGRLTGSVLERCMITGNVSAWTRWLNSFSAGYRKLVNEA